MRTQTVVSPLSRVLLGAIFISAGLNKLRDRQGSIQYMKYKNMNRATGPLLTAATALEIGAGAALVFGIGGRLVSTLLAGYLVPTSFIFHDFWKAEGAEKQNQTIHFMKNLSIIGGLLTVAQHGSGAASLDVRRLVRALPSGSAEGDRQGMAA